jgi:ADP-ribose pyrophosphatase YjhB (NUDIX family)
MQQSPPNATETPPRPFFRLMQRVFLFSQRLRRGMTLGVRGMVIDEENRIFLVKHSYVRGWHMPGGGVEAGETMAQALAKELREEGNLEITSDAVLLGIYCNRVASARDHVAVYVIRHFRQTAPTQPNREIVETGFFPLMNLPADTTQATRRRIAEATDGRKPDEDW